MGHECRRTYANSLRACGEKMRHAFQVIATSMSQAFFARRLAHSFPFLKISVDHLITAIPIFYQKIRGSLATKLNTSKSGMACLLNLPWAAYGVTAPGNSARHRDSWKIVLNTESLSGVSPFRLRWECRSWTETHTTNVCVLHHNEFGSL